MSNIGRMEPILSLSCKNHLCVKNKFCTELKYKKVQKATFFEKKKFQMKWPRPEGVWGEKEIFPKILVGEFDIDLRVPNYASPHA